MSGNDYAKECQKLVERLCQAKTTGPMNQLQLNSLKSLVRGNDHMIAIAYEVLFKLLGRQNAVVRYNCVQLADYMVNRSTAFRSMLVKDLRAFMRLSVGLEGCRLPSPADDAVKLKSYAIDCLKRWNEKYGSSNKGLRLGYEYLERSIEQNMLDNVTDTVTAQRQAEQEKQRRLVKVKREVYMRNVEDAVKVCEDSKHIVTEMNEVFKILVPPNPLDSSILLHSDKANEKQDNDDSITVVIPSKRPMGVAETAENAVLYETAREHLGVIRKRILPFLSKWIRTLVVLKYEDESEDFYSESEERDNQLQSAIEAKNQVQTVEAMCMDLGIVEEEDEDMMEVDLVPIDISNQDKGKGKEVQEIRETVSFENDDVIESAPDEPSSSNSIREELLKIAPVIEYDDDLYYWDKDKIQFNTTGIDFHHRFLGDGKGENYLSKDTMEELRKRKVYYSDLRNNEGKSLQQCRYPMKHGKICPRMHAEECTYHGKIIPRDETGAPLDSNHETPSQTDSEVLWNAVQADLIMDSLKSSKRKRETKQEAGSSMDRLKRKMANPKAVHRQSKQISAQENMKLRERNAFRW